MMALSRYKISFLVRKPGGTYTFGTHDGGVVVSHSLGEAIELLRNRVELEGWEVERPLRIVETPLTGDSNEKSK